MYKVSLTLTGRYALVNSQGVTEYVFVSDLAAQSAADFKNRANYEPTVSPYDLAEGACETPVGRGRWDNHKKKEAA